MANILAIVGRPNVGKSTLFNRLIEQRQAIMDNESGVTRDRHYGQCQWNGKTFTVIDTGGYVEGSDDILEKAIRDQVKEALNEASAIAFMVDCGIGLHALDQDFAAILREINKPVYLVANKADTPEKELNSSEFYALGLNAKIFPVCSTSGSGSGDLLDKIVEHFVKEVEPEADDLPKIAIIGRPNVGKSSFINALLGKERTIVTEVAGTTRDAINTHYNRFGKDFILTDTAGIRKKSKVHKDIEFYSVLRAIQALQNADVSVVMLDATQGLESQDMTIISLSHKYKKGTLIMVNKWDLIENKNQIVEEYRKFFQEKLGYLSYIPIIFTSVLDKQRIFQAIELALKIYKNKTTRIATSKLNDKLQKDIEHYPPPAVRGHYIKIKYITQLPTNGVTFAFFTNFPQYIKESYQRYLSNKIREHFGFDGVPLTVVFRKK